MNKENRFKFYGLPLEIAIKILKDVPFEKIPREVFEVQCGDELIQEQYRTTGRNDLMQCRGVIIEIEKIIASNEKLSKKHGRLIAQYDLDKLLLRLLKYDNGPSNNISPFIKGCILGTIEYRNISMYNLLGNIVLNQYWKKHYDDYCGWNHEMSETIQKKWIYYVIKQNNIRLLEKITIPKTLMTKVVSKVVSKYTHSSFCMSYEFIRYLIENVKNVNWYYIKGPSNGRKLAERMSLLDHSYPIIRAIHENEDIFNVVRKETTEIQRLEEEFYMKELVNAGQIETFKYMFETVKIPVTRIEGASIMISAIRKGHHDWVAWASDKKPWKKLPIDFTISCDKISIICLCYVVRTEYMESRLSNDMISTLCTRYEIENWEGVVQYSAEHDIDLRELLPPHIIYVHVGDAIDRMIWHGFECVNLANIPYLSIPIPSNVDVFRVKTAFRIYTHMCDVDTFKILLSMKAKPTINWFFYYYQCYQYTVCAKEKTAAIKEFSHNQSRGIKFNKDNLDWFHDMSLSKESWMDAAKILDDLDKIDEIGSKSPIEESRNVK